jgi:DNA-binding NtrC family response regulator
MESGTPAKRHRVMVVEDDSRLRRAFAWALERQFDVVSAATVEEAVEKLSNDRDVELVLCDLMLDGQTGVELFDKLTETSDPRSRRFVLMTAYETARMKLPDVPMLLKPFTAITLREKLSELLAS